MATFAGVRKLPLLVFFAIADKTVVRWCRRFCRSEKTTETGRGTSVSRRRGDIRTCTTGCHEAGHEGGEDEGGRQETT